MGSFIKLHQNLKNSTAVLVDQESLLLLFTMSKTDPKKLRHCKWTALQQKHFIITNIEFDEIGEVTLCQLEALLTRTQYDVNWRELTDESC
ncbi:TIGR02450 family Trp-rich protein [Shewanella abyssi]|uniref:TIGR02450 family Trp-rich protein n=1 Tax=Shewanella abyssi TaxID=311789 RepID=UPI00200E5BA8|nr:TIGR02450 family Trp-rich protein [Shewanella abyssi]MCL1050266.1 TIGR02450 family Trp-rich protein [Shewanella abyssi]